ncbi:type IV toxin-antitoxin system AbiEi family antitoxin domain-containing protein [Rathayibacter sp. CAU 1779]
MPRTITLPEAAALLRSRQDLTEQGMTDREIAGAVESGRLHRVRRGWYIPGRNWHDLWPEGKHLVHVVAVSRDARGSDPVFSGASAAVIHGLPLYRLQPRRVEVLVGHPRHIHSSPDVMRHEGRLAESDVTRVAGMTVTSIERTVADLTRVVTPEAAVSAADASLRRAAVRENVQNDDLAGAWREGVSRQLHNARGLRGIRQARWVATFADGRAQLPGESVSRLQLHRLGFRQMSLQVPVPSPTGGTYWVDFGFDDVNAFGEFDGEGKYTDEALRSGRTVEQVLLDEKYREDWIRGTTSRPMLRWGDKHAATTAALGSRLSAFGVKLP